VADDLPPSFLLDPVPNDEAADWISKKPLTSGAVFKRLLPEIRARAFAVAGVECAGTLRTLRDTLAELPRGGDWDELKESLVNDLHPFLASADDPENLGAATRRAELLLRTHGFQAYAVAQHEALADQRDIFPFQQYLSMGDSKVRPSHAALDGVVLPANSPFWLRHTPPWDWGCRCRVAPLLPEDVDEIREADRTKPPEDQRVIEGPALTRLEGEGRINRTVRDETGKVIRDGIQGVDVKAPADKGDPRTAYRFEPSSLRLTPAQLQSRMRPTEWADFVSWAQAQPLHPTDSSSTVWQWMSGESAASAPVGPSAPVAPLFDTAQTAPHPTPPAKAVILPEPPIFAKVSEASAWIKKELGLENGLTGLDVEGATNLAHHLRSQLQLYGPAIRHAGFIGTDKAYRAAVKKALTPAAEAAAAKYYTPGTKDFGRFVTKYITMRTSKSRNAIAFASTNLGGLNVPGIVMRSPGYKTSDLTKLAEMARKTNWTIAGDPPNGPHAATWVHEMGHIVDFHVSARSDPHMQTLLRSFSTTEVAQGLSRYGSTNHAEIIAESWAEVHTTANPRPLAKQVVSRLYALMQAKNPTWTPPTL
jgi:SPP1 gp7 family putative phage head morphogenesis protein